MKIVSAWLYNTQHLVQVVAKHRGTVAEDDGAAEHGGKTAWSMEIVRLTRADFEEFRVLQRRRRWDWPAVFSANRQGHIWAYIRKGYTPHGERQDLRGVSDVLDIVANKYRISRSPLGRFFIDERGGFYKDEENELHRFCEFEWTDR